MAFDDNLPLSLEKNDTEQHIYYYTYQEDEYSSLQRNIGRLGTLSARPFGGEATDVLLASAEPVYPEDEVDESKD